MATYSTGANVHKTLTTTAADAVTITGHRYVWVYNADASVHLYFRFDGTTAVSAADGTYRVPPATSMVVDVFTAGNTAASSVVLSVVGSGNAYSVQGLD